MVLASRPDTTVRSANSDLDVDSSYFQGKTLLRSDLEASQDRLLDIGQRSSSVLP